MGFHAAALASAVSALCGVASLAKAGRAPGRMGPWSIVAVASSVIAGGIMTYAGMVMATLATWKFSRGRQLRRLGRVLLPGVRAGSAWAEVPLTVTVDDPTRRALAAQWRENGRTEHASVAAFARLTLDLMALGAPPALVAAASRDGPKSTARSPSTSSLHGQPRPRWGPTAHP